MKGKNKYKSKWEQTVADQMVALGYPVEYESVKIPYLIPESKHIYTPDFPISKKIFLEAKGKFVFQDRKKHLLLKEQYPDLTFILVFQNANQRISKKSKTTYSMWCDKHGIKWVHRNITNNILPKRKTNANRH